MRYLILLMCLVGCNFDSNAQRALESNGFTDIAIGDWAAFACGDGDLYTRKFTANNVQGKQIHGYICCGSFKGCTVRF